MANLTHHDMEETEKFFSKKYFLLSRLKSVFYLNIFITLIVGLTVGSYIFAQVSARKTVRKVLKDSLVARRVAETEGRLRFLGERLDNLIRDIGAIENEARATMGLLNTLEGLKEEWITDLHVLMNRLSDFEKRAQELERGLDPSTQPNDGEGNRP